MSICIINVTLQAETKGDFNKMGYLEPREADRAILVFYAKLS